MVRTAVKKSFAGRPYFSGAFQIAPAKKYGSQNDFVEPPYRTASFLTAMKPYSISFISCQVDKLESFLKSLTLEERTIVQRSFSFLGVNLLELLTDNKISLPVVGLSVGSFVKVICGSSSSDYVVRKFRIVNGQHEAFIFNASNRFGFWCNAGDLQIIKTKKDNTSNG